MPKAAPIQTSFNGGIQTPLLDGHINAPRRENSVADSENLIPLKHGPMVRRGGTKFVSQQRSTAVTRTHLIPFKYSDTESYMLEISGDSLYGSIMRVYKDNALVMRSGLQRDIDSITNATDPVVTITGGTIGPADYLAGGIVQFSGLDDATELNNGQYKIKQYISTTQFSIMHYDGTSIGSLTSAEGTGGTGVVDRPANTVLPYCWEDLFDDDNVFRVNYAQSNDVLYLAHPDYPLQVLSRTADDAWTCQAVDFDNGPWLRNDAGAILTTIAPVGGSKRVFDITMDINTFDRLDHVHTGTVSNVTTGATTKLTVTAHTFVEGDKIKVTGIGGTVELNNRTFIVSAPVNANDFIIKSCETTPQDIDSTSYTAFSSNGTASTINTARLVRIFFEGGGGRSRYRWFRVSDYTSATQVEVTIDSDKAPVKKTSWHKTAADSDDPTTEDPTAGTGTGDDIVLGAYSEVTGYPSVVAIHEGRVWVGGSTNEPRRLDSTRTGGFSPTELTFTPENQFGETLDDLGIGVSVGGGDGSPLTWLESVQRGLAVGTTNRVGILSSGDGTALTPSNASYRTLSTNGTSVVRPIQVDSALLFVNRSRRKLHELAYNIQSDGHIAPDMSELAEHLTRTGITSMAYQQEPINTMWLTLADGSLISMVYEKNADVIAWSRHTLGGTDVSIESVAVIPSQDLGRDEAWISVSRTVAGATVSYVEYITRWYEDDIGQNDAFHVDSGVYYQTTLVDVEGISKANPAVVTETSHGLSEGDVIYFENVVGMTELNDRYFKVATPVNANDFALDLLDGTAVDSTSFGTFNATETTAAGGGYRPATNSFSGLNHLVGQTVEIYADGREITSQSVTVQAGTDRGQVTLGTNEYGATVAIGLPNTWEMKTHRIEAGSADGTAQGKIKRMEEVIVRVRDTLGLKFGKDSTDLYTHAGTSGIIAGEAPDLETGDIVLQWPGGYDREGRIFLKGEGPFPAQIQAIMPKVTTND